MNVPAIDPRELQRKLASSAPPLVLDVRENDEVALCKIAGSLHVPMGELARRADELDRSREIVCVCHHGVRSARVAAWLVQSGFPRVLNLSGGIDRWASEVEPAMARY